MSFYGRVSQSVFDILVAERDRWLLWLPVFLGAGVGIYFVLGREPAPWTGAAALIVFLVLASMARRRQGFLPLLIALVALALGFSAAQWRVFETRHIILDRKIGPTSISGQVARSEIFPDGARLTLVAGAHRGSWRRPDARAGPRQAAPHAAECPAGRLGPDAGADRTAAAAGHARRL